uniref:SFRICE_017344 n=1 Tax=Spodoptera frugiperda TaxID=7108 RepID=A0A2H1VPT3_SPOFR
MQKNLSPRHPNKVRKKLAYSEDKIISMNIENQQDYLLKTPDREGSGTFIQPTESQSNDLSIDSASQHISDTQTPEDCSKSDSIEILSCKTQTLTNIPIIKQENSTNSDTSNYFEKNKKLKYKKGAFLAVPALGGGDMGRWPRAAKSGGRQ